MCVSGDPADVADDDFKILFAYVKDWLCLLLDDFSYTSLSLVLPSGPSLSPSISPQSSSFSSLLLMQQGAR